MIKRLQKIYCFTWILLLINSPILLANTGDHSNWETALFSEKIERLPLQQTTLKDAIKLAQSEAKKTIPSLPRFTINANSENLLNKKLSLTLRNQNLPGGLNFMAMMTGTSITLNIEERTIDVQRANNELEASPTPPPASKLDSWKNNIQLRQQLINSIPGKATDEMLVFAEKQLQESSIFREGPNKQSTVPNELIALQLIIAEKDANERLQRVFKNGSISAKLYAAAGLKSISPNDNYASEELLRNRKRIGHSTWGTSIIKISACNDIYTKSIQSGIIQNNLIKLYEQ